MSNVKVTRLMALFQVLLGTASPLTSREIRERVSGYSDDREAFRRTFERDKRELGDMLGHPLRAEPVPGADPPREGYRLRPGDAYLADPGLTQDERRALVLASSAVRLAGIDPSGGVTKLGGGAADTGTDVASSTELPADAAVVSLFQGVAERRPASFTYRSAEREVHPLRLRFTKGRWYLTAWDTGRAGERQFRLDRLESPVVLGVRQGFAPRPVTSHDALDEPWAMGDGPALDVRVRVDGARADSARLAVPTAPVEEHDDGSIVLTLATRNVDALIGFVLGFVDEAEVLSPPEVRQVLVDRLRQQVGASP